MMFNLFDLNEEVVSADFNFIRDLQKELGYIMPPDFIDFNINFGKLSHNKTLYSISSFPFSRTVSVIDYSESIDYFKQFLDINGMGNFMVFIFTFDPNQFILMGIDGKEKNRIFGFNDAIDSIPKFICDSYHELFKLYFIEADVV